MKNNKAVKDHIATCPGCSNNPELFFKDIHPKILKALDEEDRNKLRELYDPLYWAQKNLYLESGGYQARQISPKVIEDVESNSRLLENYGDEWYNIKADIINNPHYSYQEKIIRCTFPRMVVRAGRRLGKSNSISVKVLHKCFTIPNYAFIIFTPNVSQLKLIMGDSQGETGMISQMITSNPVLRSSIRRHIQSPHPMIEFMNGSSIAGFVSGSSALRGQRADGIWLDEASYLTPEDIGPVIGLLNEKPDILLIATSTPRGQKDWFKDKTEDPGYKKFFFPGVFNPNWHTINPITQKTIAQDVRDEVQTEGDFNREALALFDSEGDGVFRDILVKKAYTNNLVLGEHKYQQDWKYIAGVDWNSAKNGTRIFIVGTKDFQKFEVVHHDIVSVVHWTQTMAVQKIMEVNRKWNLHAVYVDAGFGSTAIENIRLYALSSNDPVDRRLIDSLKPIDLGSSIEINDPFTNQKIPKPMKPFMVNNAVRFFEKEEILIPTQCAKLKEQLENYQIRNITEKGHVSYGPPKGLEMAIGDHDLDAFMFALLGFTMEFSKLAKPNVAVIGQLIQHVNITRLTKADETIENDKNKIITDIKIKKPPSRQLNFNKEQIEEEIAKRDIAIVDQNLYNKITGNQFRLVGGRSNKPSRSKF